MCVAQEQPDAPAQSKNQIKRLKRLELRSLSKKQWRKDQRSKKKARRLAGEAVQKNGAPILKAQNQPTVSAVFDAGFNDLMTEREISSLASQLVRCYASNRRVQQPVKMTVCSFGGALQRQMERCHADFQRYNVNFLHDSISDAFLPSEMIYLTADATEELAELSDNQVLVIGALIDRNRHKGVALEKAKELGVKTAKLPIPLDLQLSGSSVLTCNHVFEILLKKLNGLSWLQAMEQVIPPRKLRAADPCLGQ